MSTLKTFGQGMYGIPDDFYEGAPDPAYESEEEILGSVNARKADNHHLAMAPTTAPTTVPVIPSFRRQFKNNFRSNGDLHAIATALAPVNELSTPFTLRDVSIDLAFKTGSTLRSSNSSIGHSTPATSISGDDDNSSSHTAPSTPGSVLQRGVQTIKDFFKGTSNPNEDGRAPGRSIKSWVLSIKNVVNGKGRKKAKVDAFPNLPVYAGKKRQRDDNDSGDADRTRDSKRPKTGNNGMNEARYRFEQEQIALTAQKIRIRGNRPRAPPLPWHRLRV
ncbi:hypothetical protein K490DRAFT_59448 [Saccharata proteae CBS 121410]|uniref:Uncharacterized protein n=1 Tax=Saccharata proteae CBS 121410 TaxID=1314787 RepID=A0A9P4HQ59_9PEZI|nr:hypothetical protein K490DRAFT_59448 [Saccharata proteae CBS 121410]